ncbi:cytochrome P450 [Hymenopellis radicata]|nr:cytochrome P450 [Hymenopellis radicata]
MTSTLLILSLGLLGLFFLLLSHGKHPNLPPGPRPLPILGNLLQLSKDPWRFVFPQWKQKYGPLTYFRVGGTGVLLLNTQNAAAALLDKRSAIYSSRPRFIVASEYICGGLFSVLMPYTDLYRRMRKCAQEALMNRRNSSGITRPVQERMATRLCLKLLSASDKSDWIAECHGTFLSILTSFLYGEALPQSASEVLEKVFDLIVPAITDAAAIGNRLVEFFPWLRYLPSQWKTDAQKLERRASAAFTDAYTASRASSQPSIGRNVAMMQERHLLSDRECGWLLSNFFLAGADSSDHTFRWRCF